MTESRVVSAARAADRDGRGVALLRGRGWGGIALGIDPVEEHRIEHGPDAMDRCEALLDRLGRESSDARGWNGLAPAPRYIGYVAYEAARSLERPAWTPKDERPSPIGAAVVLRRFAAVIRRDPHTGFAWIEGDDRVAIDRAAKLLRDAPDSPPSPAKLELAPIDGDDAHRRRIETTLSRIERGDLYQTCVARSFTGETRATVTALLDAMLARTDARFGCALDLGDHAVVASSPELFLDVRGTRVLTSPIKGTRPRGRDAERDRAHVDDLASDPKEEAELVMVVDLERNDLGRIADIGSVRVLGPARIETSTTVHHRVRDVVAHTRAGLGAIFRATFPSGSVTGAPKVRAMELIAELERDRRGIYCGAILAIDRRGDARASMAIRTLVVDRSTGRAHYVAGGGIVAGSIPDREVEETHWKSRQVMPR